jgi:DNA replicative helicase MCM subunit Mcm2 (Cdc46/Mcm family)
MCGKAFNLELDVGTYVTAESAAPSARGDAQVVLRGHDAKVDFVRRAMRALASKDASGTVEISEIVELAEKVGLARDEVDDILNSEKSAGHVYEPKPGVLSFTAPPERSKG